MVHRNAFSILVLPPLVFASDYNGNRVEDGNQEIQGFTRFEMLFSTQRTCLLFLLGVLLLTATAACQAQTVTQNAQPLPAKRVEASQQDGTAKSVDLSGCWSGSWMSCKNGHNGKLSATFCRINDCQVRARFKGIFAKVIPFRYPATLTIVEERPGLMRLSGSQRLGPIMGSFTYSVTITPDRFEASYQSKRDWGQWTLSR